MKRTGKEQESSKSTRGKEEAAGSSLQYAPPREPSVSGVDIIPTSTRPIIQRSKEVQDELAKKGQSPLMYASAVAPDSGGAAAGLSSSSGVHHLLLSPSQKHPPTGRGAENGKKSKELTHAAPMEESSLPHSPRPRWWTFFGVSRRQRQQRPRGRQQAHSREPVFGSVEEDSDDPELPGATAIQDGNEIQRTKGRLTAQDYDTPTLQPRRERQQQEEGNDIPVVTPEGIIDGKEIQGEDDTKISRVQKIAIAIILIVIIVALGFGIPAILNASENNEPKTKYVAAPTISPAPTQSAPSSIPTPSPTASPQPSRSPSSSHFPSSIPTLRPTASPQPSDVPSTSAVPSATPSRSIAPSACPSRAPSLSAVPSETPSQSINPSASPSDEPSTTYEKNLPTTMKEFALTLSKKESLDDPSSPQSKAIEWLVQDELEHQSGWDIIESTQRYVLAVLYHSTGGDGWWNNAQRSWFQVSSVCQWSSHVICNENGAILSLALAYDNLRGNVPIELGTLTALTRLELSNNALTGSIPSELGQLTAIESLWLFGNALTGPIPSELGQLTAMTSMRMSRNALSGPIPSELGRLTSMTDMSLYRNALTGPVPSEVGRLTAMEELSLGENALSGAIPSELDQLTVLEDLYLYQNALTGPMPSELGQLTAMEVLNLRDNSLTGPIPSELGQLTALYWMFLHDNSFTGPIPSELGQLTSMTDMSLYRNALTGPIPSELGQLTEMTSLYWYDNALTGTVPDELTQLTNLRYIYLHKSDLTGTVPSGFCAAPFPDWRNSWQRFATDCISEIQCDCCNFCYNEAGICFEWSNSRGDFVSSFSPLCYI